MIRALALLALLPPAVAFWAVPGPGWWEVILLPPALVWSSGMLSLAEAPGARMAYFWAWGPWSAWCGGFCSGVHGLTLLVHQGPPVSEAYFWPVALLLSAACVGGWVGSVVHYPWRHR